MYRFGVDVGKSTEDINKRTPRYGWLEKSVPTKIKRQMVPERR